VRQAAELAGGKKIEEVCASLAISPATYHLWQEQIRRGGSERHEGTRGIEGGKYEAQETGGSVLGQVGLKGLLEGIMAGAARKRTAVGRPQRELELGQYLARKVL
jgi:hypothetical protein